MNASLECSSCRSTYAAELPVVLCDCGGTLTVRWHGRVQPEEAARRPPSMWRYAEAIPVEPVVTLGEGGTPLLPERIGAHSLFVKCDYTNPTGSFKDRGSAVVVSHLAATGARALRMDSSGNAGISMAAYGARAGLRVRVFVPDSAPEAKTALAESFGAEVVRVPGPRSAAAAECRSAEENDVYAGHALHPFFLEGTKTAAWEIAESLDWTAPDAVVAPVGNGTLLLGLARGFTDLREAGITAMPRLVAVQPEACCPIASLAWTGDRGGPWRPSVADGLSVDAPPRAAEVVSAVERSGGAFVTVPEGEIEDAWNVARRRGHPVDRNAAAALAGALRYVASPATAPGSGRGPSGRGVTVVLLTGRDRS